jgi:hypothetical protein
MIVREGLCELCFFRQDAISEIMPGFDHQSKLLCPKISETQIMYFVFRNNSAISQKH